MTDGKVKENEDSDDWIPNELVYLRTRQKPTSVNRFFLTMALSRTRFFEGFLLVYTFSSLCLVVVYLNFQFANNSSGDSVSPVTQRGCFYLLGIAIGCVMTCSMFIIYYIQTERIFPALVGLTSLLIELEIVFCFLINFSQFETKVARRETTLIATVILTGYFVVVQSFGLVCAWLHSRLSPSHGGNY